MPARSRRTANDSESIGGGAWLFRAGRLPGGWTGTQYVLLSDSSSRGDPIGSGLGGGCGSLPKVWITTPDPRVAAPSLSISDQPQAHAADYASKRLAASGKSGQV